MGTLETIVTAVLTSGIFAAVFNKWIEKAIEHKYEQKLELLKVQLQRESDKEIERLKTDLQIRAARSSHVFELMAKVIAETYSKLLDYRDSVHTLLSTGAPPQDQNNSELVNKTHDKRKEFEKYFSPNRIFIPKSTREQITKCTQTLMGTVLAYSLAKEMKGTPFAKQHYKDLNELTVASNVVLGLLEDEFQKLLGFEIEQPK